MKKKREKEGSNDDATWVWDKENEIGYVQAQIPVLIRQSQMKEQLCRIARVISEVKRDKKKKSQHSMEGQVTQSMKRARGAYEDPEEVLRAPRNAAWRRQADTVIQFVRDKIRAEGLAGTA